MKRGVRPIAHARDQSVFERIDTAIFDMSRVIGFIADHMLPEPPLPDAAFAARLASSSEPFVLWQRSAKRSLINCQRVEKSL